MRTAISRAPSSRSPTRSNTASTSATTLSDAIAARWRSLGRRRALIPYLTAGFPNPDVSLDALRRVAAAGADFIEVGVPFSDPLADGPTIQRTTQTALEQGMNVPRVLALVREAAVAVPVIIMTYLNPVMAFGIDRFVAEAPAAGVAGVLLTDLPAGADSKIETAVTRSALALIRLVAPTTDDERLAAAVNNASGFIYLISRLGVTGAREAVPPDLEAQVARIRAVTQLPIAVGFGIGSPAQAATPARSADGGGVGSALLGAPAAGGGGGAGQLGRALAGGG